MRKLVLVLVAVIMAFSSYSGVLRLPTEALFASILFFAIYSMIAGGNDNFRIDSKYICLFLLICFFSIVINDPPSLFRSYERFLIFLMIVIAFSDMIRANGLANNRVLLFKAQLWIASFFSIGSFFAYFLGINFFVRNGDLLDMTNVGAFSGLTAHSMLLGPISSLSAIFLLTKFLTSESKKKRNIWLVLMFFSLGAILFSASRGALVGLFAGAVSMLYRFSKGRVSKMIKTAMIGLLIIAFTSPIWINYTSMVMKKNAYNVEQGGTFYSRDQKFQARMYEIENNFFTGVGFAAIDPSHDFYNFNTGTVEPGSSWLAVFSMTGFFGAIIFLLINIRAIRKSYNMENFENSILTLGILSFFFVHMIVEGYVLAGGSILCGLFWLAIGVSNSEFSVNCVCDATPSETDKANNKNTY